MVPLVYSVRLPKKPKPRGHDMNKSPKFIQTLNSDQDVSCAGSVNPAASHLVAYLQKLKLQKIFRTA